MISACIIGAGPAGLCALKQCLDAEISAIIFEQNHEIGGTWAHSPTGENHSSLYDNLITNLPKELMAFPDVPFPSTDHSYLHHTEVLQYLNDFANQFHLRPHIRLNHSVISVNKTESGWTVETCNKRTKTNEKWQFDSVFVCNGHFSEPRLPEIDNLSRFEGLVLHSHFYRSPIPFTNKTVACVGAGFSGIDISSDLTKFAKKVYLCHRKPLIKATLPASIEQKPTIVSILQSGIVQLSDKTTLADVDVIVFCTGYHYHFPFFHPTVSNVSLEITNNRVTPVYQHLIHIQNPSLFLVGLNSIIVPFVVFHAQVQFCVAILKGTFQLPSTEEMLKWEADDYHHRLNALGLSPRQAHYLSDLQWEYMRSLSELAGFKPPFPPVLPKLLTKLRKDRELNLVTYKTSKFRLVDAENFVEIC